MVDAADYVLDDLVRNAGLKSLESHPVWLALLHYKPAALTREVESQADDPDFFLAENGRHDAAAELYATLVAMLKPAAESHAQCRFPARWFWLKRQLEIGDRYNVPCPDFEAWFGNIEKDSITMVFPSMYLNNPGSMFGHTFLRLDDDSGNVLLSNAMNYAAAYDPEDDGFSYVLKGLFGGYRGVFSLRPYFETVQTYSNIENRDIWEYRLAYSRDEIEQLLRHLWEVSRIDFDYYFFRENCSYRLLSLLDAIRLDNTLMRPGLTEDGAFQYYALPVDTVRALDDAGLVVSRTYRPSLASQIRAEFDNLSAADAGRVIDIADGQYDPAQLVTIAADDSAMAGHLMLAYKLRELRQEHETQQANDILAARSRMGAVETAGVAEAVAPDLGHRSARIAIGGGERNRETYAELSFRPGYHDLLDAAEGFVNGAEINVLDASLRWYAQNNRLRLERLRLFNLVSLNPLRRWTRPMSWQLDVRLDQTRYAPADTTLVFITRGGAGATLEGNGMSAFAMLNAEAGIADEYVKGYSLLGGLQAGVHADIGSSRLLLSASADQALSGYEFDRDTYTAGWQLDLGRNSAVRFAWERREYCSGVIEWEDTDWQVKLNGYF